MSWPAQFINANQSHEERQAKYLVARLHDVNSYHANVYRDWRWSKIARRFGYQTVSDLLLVTGIDLNFYIDDEELNTPIE